MLAQRCAVAGNDMDRNEATITGSLPPPEQARTEDLRAALRWLIRRYVRAPSPALAGAVAAHLQALLLHPDLHAAPRERRALRQLWRDWRVAALS